MQLNSTIDILLFLLRYMLKNTSPNTIADLITMDSDQEIFFTFGQIW